MSAGPVPSLPPSTSPGLSSRRVLVMASMLHGSTHLYWVLLHPLNSNLKAYFGFDQDKQIAVLHTLFMIVYAAANLLAGVLATRFSARTLLAAGPIINGVCFMLMSLVGPGDFVWLCALHAVGALGGGLYHPVANLLLTRSFPHDKGKALGYSGIGASVAFIAGPWGASALVKHGGWTWQQTTILFGAMGVACGVVAWFALREAGSVRDPQDASEGLVPLLPAEAVGKKTLRAVLGFTVLAVLVMAGREIAAWGTTGITSQFLQKTYPLDTPDAGFLVAMIFVTGLVLQPLVGKWSDKMGRERVMALCMIVLATTLYFLPRTPREMLFVPYLVLGAGMQASIPVFEALVADRTPVKMRGLVFGITITAGIMIGSIGPMIASGVADAGGNRPEAYRHAFAVMSVLVSVTAALTFVLKPAARALGLIAPDPPPAGAPSTLQPSAE